MKNRNTLFLLALLLVINSLSGQDFLRVSGKQIVTGSGEPYLLKGMGLGGWMLQEGYMLQTAAFANPQHQIRARIEGLIGPEDTQAFYDAWLANHVRKIDIDSLASWGFNSVRLPMHYNLFTLPIEDEPVSGEHTWMETGFDLIDELIDWCRPHGMYIILDLHAAPGGQGQDAGISDYDPSKPSLWESEENRAKTVALWKRIAERYADEPLIGGYDLINEPNWPLEGNVLLAELYQDITTAVREVDNNHILFIEGNWFANDFTGLTPPWDEQMVYSPHKYWSINDQASIQWVIDIREQHDRPIYFGETGENSNTWFRDAIKLFDEHEMGWAWWPMKKIESIAGPLSVPKSADYQVLLDYWQNGGTQPTAEFARATLMQLTEDLKLERTIYQRDVIDAMFRQVTEEGTLPFRTQAIPGRLMVTDFDLGPNGQAYFDTDVANYQVSTGTYTAWNQGWSYRNDGVDIERSEDPEANGYNVGWLSNEEWMQYDVDVQESATYQVSVRVASNGGGGKFHLKADGAAISPPVEVTSTGGWQTWQTVTIEDVILSEEDQKLIFFCDEAGFNLSTITFEVTGATTDVTTSFVQGATASNQQIRIDLNKRIEGNDLSLSDFRLLINQSPATLSAITSSGRSVFLDVSSEIQSSDVLTLTYSGNSVAATDGTLLENFTEASITNTLTPVLLIPGQIEAEDFLIQSGISLESTTDAGGGQNIGFLDRGDYLDYEVNILEEGDYDVTYRTAALSESGAVRLSLVTDQGLETLHEVSFPPTGDWQSWANTTAMATLPAGRHILRMEITEPLFNINWFSFEAARVLNLKGPDILVLYPNPTSELLNLKNLPERKGRQARIYDLQGNLHFIAPLENASGESNLHLSGLDPGPYLIVVSTEAQLIYSSRLMIR